MSGIFKDSEQGEFIQAFVDEGREMLENVEPLLIELESSSGSSSVVDSEVLNTIFRLFHSLKGAAGFLHLNTVAKVTHEAETLLDMFRKGTAILNSGHIDLLNRTTDFMGKMMNSIENKLDDSGFDDEAVLIVKDLNLTIKLLSGETVEAPAPAPPVAPQERIEEAAEEPFSVETPATEETDKMQLVVTPEMAKQFVTEAEELLEKAETAIINLEKEPDNKDFISEAFRSIHSFKGNSGFFGYSDLENISHKAENVLDILRDCSTGDGDEALTLILQVIDFLRGGISDIYAGKDPVIPGTQGLIALLESAAANLGKSAKATKPGPSKANKEISEESKPAKPAGGVPTISLPAIDTAPSTGSSNAATGVSAADDDHKAADRKVQESKNTQRQSIRVDVEKLDILMDLVGELVIAEAMVAQNPDIKGLGIPLDRFEKSIMHLDKITRDLQSVSTSIRMIPLSGTFRKMIRLVRDLGQKSGKKVSLEIIGEETEVDKTVIEQINDPLVHIIRNSIDHGLEMPDDRLAKGKPALGNVTLEAKYVGGEVWILIRDDGAGLNREKILSKARERGLIDNDGSEMKNEDVFMLIFQPGFSTADKITDVSGRGVGMDVVRRNIEGIHGKVEVRSEKDRGTMVILRIPLTLAIIDGMIVQAGGNLYTIPVISIKESFKIKQSSVTRTMDGMEIVNIRGQLLPVIRVHELFNISHDRADLESGTIIVAENEEKSVCLFIDEVINQQQIVVKGLSNYIGNIKGVSGCTILGDGDISLILDIAGIIDLAETGYVQGMRTFKNPQAQTLVNN
jgi:two-component system, chemotaxis family, sensor kinase CheA